MHHVRIPKKCDVGFISANHRHIPDNTNENLFDMALYGYLIFMLLELLSLGHHQMVSSIAPLVRFPNKVTVARYI